MHLTQADCFPCYLRVWQREADLGRRTLNGQKEFSEIGFLVTVMPEEKSKYKQTHCHSILFRLSPSQNQMNKRAAFWKYPLFFELTNLENNKDVHLRLMSALRGETVLC